MTTDREKPVKPADSIIGIAVTVIILVLFNRYSGRMVLSLGGSACTPVFSREALRMFLPLWNAAWVLSIGKEVLLLVRRRRDFALDIYETVLSLLDIVILYLLLTGPFIISGAMLALLAENVPFVGGAVRIILMVGFGIGLLVTAIQTVIRIIRLVREKA